MIRRILIPLGGVILATITLSGSVWAAQARVPASSYPAGAHIAYHPTFSNHQMDCAWGFFCEGNVPLFHYFTQDQLHRLSGWAESAASRSRGTIIAFQLFASRYDPQVGDDGTPWNVRAFQDLATTTHDHGYRPLPSAPALVPDAARGGVLAESKTSGHSELLVMACWTGSVEVEAIAMFDRHSAGAHSAALADLSRQVTVAMRRSYRVGLP
jgi:hypothetical protein